MEAGQNLRGEDVVQVLQRIQQERGGPRRLFCDNGSDFSSQVVDLFVGISEWGEDRLLAAGQADRQRAYRIVQRNVPERTSEHALVHNAGRSQADHRGLAERVQ